MKGKECIFCGKKFKAGDNEDLLTNQMCRSCLNEILEEIKKFGLLDEIFQNFTETQGNPIVKEGKRGYLLGG